mgnify:CR=1 FL=1
MKKGVTVTVAVPGEFMTEAEAIAEFVTQLAKKITDAGVVYNAMVETLTQQLTGGQLKKVMMEIAQEELDKLMLIPGG